MRLPGGSRDCGRLLELGWVTRQLRLAHPVDAGTETVPVEQIVGTVNRGRDFDGCWRPLDRRLEKRLSEIAAAAPVGVDEPIEAIRVDRAYFVVDGHKRVALARRHGREFLDARVSRLGSPYELTAETGREVILRTAREGEFRRHSGLASALPGVRFALTEPDDYGELLQAVQSHAYEMAEAAERFVSPPEAGADWYRTVYLPSVVAAREAIRGLIEACTDADAFLLIHRQRLAWWGTECDAPGCVAEQLSLSARAARWRPRLPGGRDRTRDAPDGALLLPLADDEPPTS